MQRLSLPKRVGCFAIGFGLALASGASAAGAEAAAIQDIARIYDMDGDTTVANQQDRFHVAGKPLTKQEGADCTLSVDGTFRRVEGTTGPSAIELIGHGEVTLDGVQFSGNAELQTITSEGPRDRCQRPLHAQEIRPDAGRGGER